MKPAVYRRVYVWELPVRLFHWVNAVCIVVLISTGLIIGKPPAISYSNEAYQQYWFGTVRFVHFVAAFIFFFNFIVRLYWGFVGNRYAAWNNFIPVKLSQWREIFHVLAVDILQIDPGERIAIGHNALAGLIYFFSFLAFMVQATTGFALYSSMSSSLLPSFFHWVVPLLGGDFTVRWIHHLGTWFFVTFSIIHVYLVFYHDYVEGRGTTSSMIGGWKFERDENLHS
jgi:Ni/Fe-hydrogenase 1 B-type cytochrome subunit